MSNPNIPKLNGIATYIHRGEFVFCRMRRAQRSWLLAAVHFLSLAVSTLIFPTAATPPPLNLEPVSTLSIPYYYIYPWHTTTPTVNHPLLVWSNASCNNITPTEPYLRVVTPSGLRRVLRASRPHRSNELVIVLFYDPHSKHSSRILPIYSALTYAYPNLCILAIDAYKYSWLNSRLGIHGLPKIISFPKAVSVLKNARQYTGPKDFDSIVEWVIHKSSFPPVDISIKPYHFDNVVLKERTDWALVAAWTFVATMIAGKIGEVLLSKRGGGEETTENFLQDQR